MPSSQVSNNFFTQRPNNGNKKSKKKRTTEKVDGAHKTFRPKCEIWKIKIFLSLIFVALFTPLLQQNNNNNNKMANFLSTHL